MKKTFESIIELKYRNIVTTICETCCIAQKKYQTPVPEHLTEKTKDNVLSQFCIFFF